MLHSLLSYRATKLPMDMLTPLKSVLNMCVSEYDPKIDDRGGGGGGIKLPLEMLTTPLKSVLNMCVGEYGHRSDTREAMMLPVEMFMP